MSNDVKVKQEVLSIAKELNAAKKFVDTTKYSIRCNVCYTNLKGSEDAVKHSKATGHINFVQIGN
jgi:ubiquitin thioesterase OTU1